MHFYEWNENNIATMKAQREEQSDWLMHHSILCVE